MVGSIHEHRTTRDAWAVAIVRLSEPPEVEPCDDEGTAPCAVGDLVTCVGDRLGLVAAGEPVRLRVEWDTSGKWGPQLRVLEQALLGISSAPQAARWLERLEGVGPVMAEALLERFGDQLIGMLQSGDADRLCEVRGISPARAQAVLSSFAAIGASGDLDELRYLDGLGCTRWESSQILRFARSRSTTPTEVMTQRPYDLMEAKGLGWSKVDKLARFAGCPTTAPARLEAGSMHVLDEQVQEGSTMIRLGHLMRASCEALGVTGDLVHAAILRCAASGRVIMAEAEGTTWVHPVELYRAERAIHRAATSASRPSWLPPTRVRTPAEEEPTTPPEAIEETDAAKLLEAVLAESGRLIATRKAVELVAEEAGTTSDRVVTLAEALLALPEGASVEDTLDAARAAETDGDW